MTVPVVNERERKTFYGAVNYYAKEVVAREHDAGNSENTVDFVRRLRIRSQHENILLIWDGASYHKDGRMREYLGKVNADEMRVYCMLFAPHAPEQNPMEDIWNISKKHIRTLFASLETFPDILREFKNFITGSKFDFPKLSLYGSL